MKNYCTLLLVLISQFIYAQEEAVVLGTWSDSTLAGSTQFDNTYNEIWGFATKNEEYAILGSTAGTHIIDVTDPMNPEEILLIPGKVSDGRIIHRDYHDHNGFLYAVADEGPSSLQIMDLQYLPDSLPVVYDSDSLIVRTHNIFIDTTSDKLYTCINRNAQNQNYFALQVYDISNPINPSLINSINSIQGIGIGQVHDAYVDNDTAYLNIGNQGMIVAEFSDAANPTIIARLESTDYPQSGYNHSGWLSGDRKTYYMADETWNRDIKVLDVSDLQNITVMDTIDAGSESPFSIAHNLIVHCNKLYASYYYDGLQVYDLTDQNQPVRTHFYTTSKIDHRRNYEGAWGVYPFLPSGNILVSDMQEGLFVFENIGDCQTSTSTQEILRTQSLSIFPNPADQYVDIQFEDIPKGNQLFAEWKTIDGKRISQSSPMNIQKNMTITTLPVENGMYLLTLQNEYFLITKKVLIYH